MSDDKPGDESDPKPVLHKEQDTEGTPAPAPGHEPEPDGTLGHNRLPLIAEAIRKHSERIGGGKRWVAVGRTGERLDLRHP